MVFGGDIIGPITCLLAHYGVVMASKCSVVKRVAEICGIGIVLDKGDD